MVGYNYFDYVKQWCWLRIYQIFLKLITLALIYLNSRWYVRRYCIEKIQTAFGSFHHKCWQHHSKGSKIGSLVGIEDERNLNSKSLLDTLPNLGKNHEIQLRLDWEHRLHWRSVPYVLMSLEYELILSCEINPLSSLEYLFDPTLLIMTLYHTYF